MNILATVTFIACSLSIALHLNYWIICTILKSLSKKKNQKFPGDLKEAPAHN